MEVSSTRWTLVSRATFQRVDFSFFQAVEKEVEERKKRKNSRSWKFVKLGGNSKIRATVESLRRHGGEKLLAGNLPAKLALP